MQDERDSMTYLALLPCMFAVYFWAGKNDLSGGYFATITLLLTVIFSQTHWLVPGVDTLVALCATMCVMSYALWYLDQEFNRAIEAGTLEVPRQRPTTLFCSTSNHDFAVASTDFRNIVELINSSAREELFQQLAVMSSEQRQGMYASIDYSELSMSAVQELITTCPQNLDANIFYGHVKICEAKRHGLVPGVMPGEDAAAALAIAFKHFRIAQRLKPDDAESLCGLIITKGCVALKDEQIEATLKELLQIDALHLHGVMSAARFLIKSPRKANAFVSLVAEYSDNELMTAIAGLVAHIECGGFADGNSVDSKVIADMYRQLRVYRRQHQVLDSWQQAICSNIIAFAFERIGDEEEATRRLDELDGKSSPYPWRRTAWPNGQLAILPF